MEINLSNQTINTVYNSLRNSKQGLKWQLEVNIPNKKININKREIIEHQLSEVEDALQIFKELIEQGGM